jgi:hypothetical protein
MSQQETPRDVGPSVAGPVSEPTPVRWTWREMVALAALLAVTSVLLFGNLDAKYLWQDEAATAVLGDRLMKFGKPLGYDGVNLITMDHFAQEDTADLEERTRDPQAAVRYYVARGDFRPDTAWIGHPWGQFAVAGASIAIFGHNTLAARAPFAVAALLTVALLYLLVRGQSKDPLMAWLAAALLATNVYWIIHSRQCRYYSLTSLMLVVTLMAFVRWQSGRRLGGTLFVVAAWVWFQVDFGTFWPVVGILMAAACLAAWPRVWRVVGVGAALTATVAPFLWYYELIGRVKPTTVLWSDKFLLNLFHLNQFAIPLVVLAAAAVVLAIRWSRLSPEVRRLMAVAVLLAATVWVPAVAPYAFHRYLVGLTPLAAGVMAWLFCEAAAWVRRRRPLTSRVLVAGAAAVVAAANPMLCNVATAAAPARLEHFVPSEEIGGVFLRQEWAVLAEEVFAPRPDPNRLTVETLRQIVSPHDEILVNYEDIPLMFYLDNPIRGGIPCFRVEDDLRCLPRVFVSRKSVGFVHASIYQRARNRYVWVPVPCRAKDVPWGDNPEPEFRMRTGGTDGRLAVFLCVRRKTDVEMLDDFTGADELMPEDDGDEP